LGLPVKYLAFVSWLLFSPMTAQARVVENVEIQQLTGTVEVKINFAFPIQYIGHVPGSNGDNIRIQFKVNSLNGLDGKDIQILSQHTDIAWNNAGGAPIREIFWEGSDARSPILSLLFDHQVKFEVHGAVDQRSVTIYLPTGGKAGTLGNGKYALLLKEAMAAVRAKDYPKAIRILTKVESSAGGSVHRQALEYLGLSRQRNNQLAHAKAEYKKFLKLYPEGADAVRVKQRLSALMTAGKKARPKLRQAKLSSVDEGNMWDTTVYGSLSQFYFRDETKSNGESSRVNVSSLNTDADLNVRMRSQDYDVRFQFVGSHQKDFILGRSDRKRLSRVYMDFQDKKHGASLRLGRQSKSTGGVLGRFDGIDVGYDISSQFTINAVYGYPVQSSRQTNINTDRKFYGASLDMGTFLESWNFTTYFIEQKNKGLIDRRAVGGEIRYYKDGRSMFAMVDYDIHFKELNLVMFNGNWILSKDTTIYMSLDYRKNPLLTTTNAIQGQGVENLSDLFTLYTNDEIFLFAADRTSTSKTATFGITRRFSEKYQLSFDLTATNLTGTVTSGGVLGFPGTGTEYYSSLQFLANGLIMDNDNHTIGIRYNDRDRDRNYTLYLNSRFRIGKSFRINPRLRVDYRSDKQDSDTRTIIRPIMKMDYRVGKWLYLEFEGGWEWRKETFSGIKQTSTGNFVYLGYRAIF